MGDLYIQKSDYHLSLSNDRVIIKDNEKNVIKEVSLSLIENILVFGKAQLTTQLLAASANNRINVFYFSGYGKFLSVLDSGREADYEKQEKQDMLFGMKVCHYVKSNAIVLVKNGETMGIGGGQTSRIWALNSIRSNHPDRDFQGCVLVSDAFFPFSDCVELAKEMGITAIIQPGGSIRDQDSIDKCNEYNMSIVFTGIRHFKH